MASGMMAPAVAPLSSRNRPSHARLSARAPAAAVSPDRKVATAMTVYLPKRSPSAPTKIWQSPYDTAKVVAITEAPPAVVPNSPAICGSSGSATRNVAADAKAAALNSTIGRTDGTAAGSGIGDVARGEGFTAKTRRTILAREVGWRRDVRVVAVQTILYHVPGFR